MPPSRHHFAQLANGYLPTRRKTARTAKPRRRMKLQVGRLPRQVQIQRENVKLRFGTAVRVILRPSANTARHRGGQWMPAGLALTEPRPETRTVNMCRGGGAQATPNAPATACP